VRARAVLLTTLSLFLLPSAARAQSPSTGGAAFAPPAATPAPTAPGVLPPAGTPNPVVEGTRARLLPDGTAAAPAAAPAAVQQAIWAVNANLLDKPYRYGGGHRAFIDSGYDCSGTVSFALNAAGLLKTPLPSGPFMSWGDAGRGQWISVYAHGGHAYAVIAGLRLDTSGAFARLSSRSKYRRITKAFEKGPRWRPTGRPSAGFTVRHPAGF
jgi:hypothetical protein